MKKVSKRKWSKTMLYKIMVIVRNAKHFSIIMNYSGAHNDT